MIVDETGTPQDLNTVLTNGDMNVTSGQTTFNKIRIDEIVLSRFINCYQTESLIVTRVIVYGAP